jgi:hypothetical protein
MNAIDASAVQIASADASARTTAAIRARITARPAAWLLARRPRSALQRGSRPLTGCRPARFDTSSAFRACRRSEHMPAWQALTDSRRDCGRVRARGRPCPKDPRHAPTSFADTRSPFGRGAGSSRTMRAELPCIHQRSTPDSHTAPLISHPSDPLNDRMYLNSNL